MAYVNLGQVVYPVGAIYASGSSTSPASFFGGSWTQITNAALRGATSVGYTGSDECRLTTNQMPSHNHAFTMGKDGAWRESVVCGTLSTTFGGGTSGWTPTGSIFDAFITSSGGGQHIPTCNAPTTVICGNVKAKSPRGDVAWPMSTLDKLCTQLEHTSSPTTQQVLQVYLEELGQLLMRDDSFVPQVVDTMLARKAERVLLLCPQQKCQDTTTISQQERDIELIQLLRRELALHLSLNKNLVEIIKRIFTQLILLGQEVAMKTDHYTGSHTYGEEQTNFALGCDA